MTYFHEKHFSDESYKEIIDVISSKGYSPLRIDKIEHTQDLFFDNADKKHYILRHDVDMSDDGALKLGKMEYEKGIVSNFFFQLNSATYQMLSPKCVEICKELQSMGHLVGLHVDSALFKEEEENILTTIDWIRASLFPMDYAVSFHRPAKETLGKTYSKFISAYDADLFNTDYYASDSRGEDSFYDKLDKMLDRNVSLFQLLLHPCWWEREPDKAKIRKRLKDRYSSFIDDYLIENFPKVFKNIIAEERKNVSAE